MSKMPAKKKSCFQITSVTQAQVAAIGATDDTESLEDPDESRTEDVSSEIYDVSRADYEPACDGSSSEEGLSNVGESEAVGAGQMSGNPSVDFRKVSGSAQQQSAVLAATGSSAGGTVNASQPPAGTGAAPPPVSSTVSCTSRFRVIKLDHGTGEPFRRGRWTCTEFYEKDSDGSSRTADSIRHVSAAPDPAADRDSGIGLTGGSVAASATHSGQLLSSTADAAVSLPRMHSAESLPQQPQHIHNQNFSGRPQGVSGVTAHGSFSNMKPPAAPPQASVAGLQPAQNVLSVGQNGPSQSAVHVQKSPVLPPSAQSMSYSPQQPSVPLSHHVSSPSSGLMQTEFYQQQQAPSVLSGLTSSLSLVTQPARQGSTSVMAPPTAGASLPSQAGAAETREGPTAAAKPVPALVQQQQAAVGPGEAGHSKMIGGSSLQQQVVGQFAAAGPSHVLHGNSGLQNVPAFTVSSSVPTTVPAVVPSASSASMPNVTTSSMPPGLTAHSRSPLGVYSLQMGGLGLMESGGVKKSEGLSNSPLPGVSDKEGVKPLMPESLQLTTPTVNSLFGIHIPVDGEDSASGTNVVAIDNKIEQAMDLVKSHLMYAVREEVEVLKEQIKELFERNSVLERENAVLKSLANSEQLSQLPAQSTPPAAAVGSSSSTAAAPPQQGLVQQQVQQVQQQAQPLHPQIQLHPKPQQLDPGQQQPNVTSA